MPAGTHYVVDTSRVYNSYYSHGTMTSPVKFSQNVVLKSIVLRFNNSGNWVGKPVVYQEDTQSVVYRPNSSKTYTVLNNSVDSEILLDQPVKLLAGVTYAVGVYSDSGPAVAALLSGSATTGAGLTVSPNDGVTLQNISSYPKRRMNVGSDSFPINEYATPYDVWRGLYVDIPNEAPVISGLTSGNINSVSPEIHWSYEDLENNNQAKYEVSYREVDAAVGYTVPKVIESSNNYHIFEQGELEEGKTYDYYVRVFDGNSWSEKAFSSFSVVAPVKIIENKVTNPSGEVSSAGWVPRNATLSYSSSTPSLWSYRGDISWFVRPTSNDGKGALISGSKATFPFGIEPGKTYSMTARLSAGDYNGNGEESRRIIFEYATSKDAETVKNYGPQIPDSFGGEFTLAHTFTVPENASGCIVGVGVATGPDYPPGVPSLIDAISITETSEPVEYFDGDTVGEGFICRWLGEPHLSASQKIYLSDSQWQILPEQSSAEASAVIDTSVFAEGQYDVQVRVSDGDAWGDWSDIYSVNLGPASNIQVRVNGEWGSATEWVKRNGVWVQASPTKKNTGGTFA